MKLSEHSIRIANGCTSPDKQRWCNRLQRAREELNLAYKIKREREAKDKSPALTKKTLPLYEYLPLPTKQSMGDILYELQQEH